MSPRGDVIPCVYWASSDVRLEDLPALGADGVLDSPQFARVRTIPEECRGCAFVDTCQGGCAGRRELAGGIERADPYCPLVRGETVDLQWTPAERRDLLKTGSACTTVLAPALSAGADERAGDPDHSGAQRGAGHRGPSCLACRAM